MPMFEDSMELAQSGELPPKDPSPPPPRPSPPTDRASTPSTPSTPSKPISIPASPYHPRRISEESIRTELCEGPVSSSPSPLPRAFLSRLSPDTQHSQHMTAGPPPPRTPPSRDGCGQVSDRAELIERIKRGESPTWIPNRHLESLYHTRSPSPSPRPPSAGTPTATSLLPAADITPERIPLEAHDHDAEASARLEDGMNIERPRSALHSGDFTQSGSTTTARQGRRSDETDARGAGTPRPAPPMTNLSAAPWTATSPPRHYTPFSLDYRSPPASSLAEIGVFRSTGPSPSSSLSSSFVYKPPTSPLVQSQSHDDDADAATGSFPMDSMDVALGSSPTGHAGATRHSSRRHTLAFPQYRPAPASPHIAPLLASPHPRQRAGSVRRESPFPYQAHQPRRSLSTAPTDSLDELSTPQPSFLARSRRPSFTLDTSPLQHASMVGSYEESILRGRMSTTPSKPLDFLAQIGVLGLGAKCKPSLRCPAHVTLPFSAVFYSYATTSHGRSKAEDGPSPYVGMVDLENGLPNAGADQRSKRKAMMPSRRALSRTRPAQGTETETAAAHGTAPAPADASELRGQGDVRAAKAEDTVMEDVHVEHLELSDAEAPRPTTAASRSHRRRPNGPKTPPGGSYRIPEQGQLQIIIKNQNKTAVKLFLIPYDLTGMEPGTKTFIRQRSFSAGPIIDNLPATSDASAADRPILRYLIHLHICCPSRGRYFLYKSIRVVFANRVPDGKEKLRNEITFPEPLYSPYKPIRVMHPPASPAVGSGPGATLAAEKAYRRRSAGFSFSAQSVSQAFDAFRMRHSPVPAVPPVPALPNCAVRSTDPASGNEGAVSDRGGAADKPPEEPEKPAGRPGARPAAAATALPLYKKLSKGDIGYGGNAFVSGSPAACEGLLSQRLRSLEVEKSAAEKSAAEKSGAAAAPDV